MMRKRINSNYFIALLFWIVLFMDFSILIAQNKILVWSDEFNESIDYAVWEYETGANWNNLHFYTGRTENLTVVDGKLNIIVREENYQGYNYTSGFLKTKLNWKYGRVEALIKLPATTGFVPAFWMLPADNIYGWWPRSGEIDIMEQPTNQPTTIYGTVHTEAYNLFGGATPPGDTIHVEDAQTSFHLYAVEWSPEQIDFYVDDSKYFTFNNDGAGSATWPFDQAFYIILNVAVGGGWCGPPDSTTIFPAIMEVDYVRVYQDFDDIAISGPEFVAYNSPENSYSVPQIDGASYFWEVPGNAQITSGQNTNQVNVAWNYFGGDAKAHIATNSSSKIIKYPVRVTPNLLKNSGFEKGVKYWDKVVNFPAEADFSLDKNTVFAGDHSLSVEVRSLGTNPWDLQCSQAGIYFEADREYRLSFWAKTDNDAGDINVAFVGFNPFTVFVSQLFHLTNNWRQFELDYKPTVSDTVALNIDFGYQKGQYYVDDLFLTTPELATANLIINADFCEADSDWNLVTLSGAQATGSVIDGEYFVSITNGGMNAWDVHLGQSGINVEQGKEYTVSFEAYAAAPRTISVIVGKNSAPWTVYHDAQIFNITTSKQRYSYSFLMNNPSDSQARFGFDIGGSTVDLYFDNIRVASGESPSTVKGIQTIAKSYQLFQNYPNPFNSSTIIRFQIPNNQIVDLTILNTRGQKVATLTSGLHLAGVHEVKWDASGCASGIYICRLEHEKGFVQSRKLLLLK